MVLWFGVPVKSVVYYVQQNPPPTKECLTPVPGSIISFTPNIDNIWNNTDVAWAWHEKPDFIALRIQYQQIGLASYQVQTGIVGFWVFRF
jgi:hypothetical protein